MSVGDGSSGCAHCHTFVINIPESPHELIDKNDPETLDNTRTSFRGDSRTVEDGGGNDRTTGSIFEGKAHIPVENIPNGLEPVGLVPLFDGNMPPANT